MTAEDIQPPKPSLPPLGLGALLGDIARLYSRHFAYFGVVTLVGHGAILIVNYQLEESPIAIDFPGGYMAFTIVFALVSSSAMLLFQAVMMRSAITLKLSGKAKFRQAVASALFGFLPLIILHHVAYLAVGLGLLLLIIPGLIIAAMVFVMVPAIVFEQRRFDAIKRSDELTRGYRVSIAVLLILILAVNGIGWAAIEGFFKLLDAAVPAGDSPVWDGYMTPLYYTIVIAADVAISAIVIPVSAIASALTYVRLRDIKEGGEDAALLEVFE